MDDNTISFSTLKQNHYTMTEDFIHDSQWILANELMKVENPLLYDFLFSTYWGAIKRLRPINPSRGKIFKLLTPHFKKGSVDLYFSKSKKKSPLIVLLPGIFGGIQRGQTLQLIELFEKNDFNLLVVPNMLASEYIESGPRYHHDPLDFDLDVLHSALEFILFHFKEHIKETHVVAESLGSLLALAWTHKDLKSSQVIKSTTLLSPPLHLTKAMTRFDHILNEHYKNNAQLSMLKKISHICSTYLFKSYPYQSADDEIRKIWNEIVFQDGFMGAAHRSLGSFWQKSPKDFSHVKSFYSFFEHYRPEFKELIMSDDSRLDLSFWLSEIKKMDTSFPFSVISSLDDFLNDEREWLSVQKKLNLLPENLILLSWGGHSGAIAHPAFEKLLRTFSPFFKN